MENMFIKSINVDEQTRIVVSVKEEFHHFLKEEMIKKMLKDSASNALGENFIKLEVSPSTFRVTVEKSSVEESKRIIEEEIAKNIEMALSFLNSMQ